jgi:S-methylmethionine-dependent homocysteine/selenocysteine methylase
VTQTNLPAGQTMAQGSSRPRAAGYENVRKLLAAGGWVLLDGPVEPEMDDLVAAHQRHVESGCDVIRTCTAGLPPNGADPNPDGVPLRWLDLAEERIEAARTAAGAAAAIAYTLGPHVDGPDPGELVRALGRLFRKAPPDLVLVETLSVIRPSLFSAVAALRSLGLPLWLSFRRCRDGLCGPSGHHWSGDEPDRFGSAARRLEQMGVSALLVNCIPPDHVAGTLEYLRYFTDVPLGIYANLEPGFEPAALIAGQQPAFEERALQWRAEGAQIVGGCCGVGPQHLRAARRRLTPGGSADLHVPTQRSPAIRKERGTTRPWTGSGGRQLCPLPFPALAHGQGMPTPTVGELFIWEYLYREGTGAEQRCLNVDSGTGLLAVQLALNGAAHVHSIDSKPTAVSSTLHCAFRNDVSSTVTAEAADVATWRPREHYDVVVASVERRATDPCHQDPGTREFDPWGRQLIDAFLAKLPGLLARDGVAYLAQSSLISQHQTAEMLAAAGLTAEVVDWRLWPAMAQPVTRSHREEIERRSDAFHLDVGTRDESTALVVVYLLKIRRVLPGRPVRHDFRASHWRVRPVICKDTSSRGNPPAEEAPQGGIRWRPNRSSCPSRCARAIVTRRPWCTRGAITSSVRTRSSAGSSICIFPTPACAPWESTSLFPSRATHTAGQRASMTHCSSPSPARSPTSPPSPPGLRSAAATTCWPRL